MPDEIDPLEFGSVEPTPEPARELVGGKPCSEPRQIEHVNAEKHAEPDEGGKGHGKDKP